MINRLEPGKRRTLRHRPGKRALRLGLGAVLMLLVSPSTAQAKINLDTTQFFQTFSWSSVGSLWPVRRPTGAAGQANAACLTARGSQARYPLPSCRTVLDGDGRGTLRLTAPAPDQLGAVFAADSHPLSHGLDATFTTYQYGNTPEPGNGIAFAIAASDPRTSATAVHVGAGAGALGYAPANAASSPSGGLQAHSMTPGLSQAYMGVGLDVAGTASSPTFQGTGCEVELTSPIASPGQVVVRGPGNVTRGYCLVNSTSLHDAGPLVLRGPQRDLPLGRVDRTGLAVRVEVAVNPHLTQVRTPSGWPVQASSYLVVVQPLTGPHVLLQGRLPDVPRDLYPEGWTDRDDLPRRVVIGVSASTGGEADAHEVQDLLVSDLLPPAGTTHPTR